MHYYNENNPWAAAWLRELIKLGEIPKGFVDEQSITNVKPSDLQSFVQCHFFAGIGGWAYALRLAGWPESRPVWTGSCPCQPFSIAGEQKGVDSEKHLWPAFRWLIAQCDPAIVFGEQVASKDGREWLSGVYLDMEAMGYTLGAADLCAAGVGSPQVRQRLWWVAQDTERLRWRGWSDADSEWHDRKVQTEGRRPLGRISNSHESGSQGRLQGRARAEREAQQRHIGRHGAVDAWNQSVLWPCLDGVYRRVPSSTGDNGEPAVERGLFPLADGLSKKMALLRPQSKNRKLVNRVEILRGAGNAIVPEVAAAFIEAYCGT